MKNIELTRCSLKKKEQEIVKTMQWMLQTNPNIPEIHIFPKQFDALKKYTKGDNFTFRGLPVLIYEGGN